MDRTLTWNDVPDLMYDIRIMARRLLRGETQAGSLRLSELVLSGLRRQKLAQQDWNDVTCQSREYFFAAMYRAMDRALKDRSRRRNAYKRKHRQQIALEDIAPAELLYMASYQPQDWGESRDDIQDALIAALVDALGQLEENHPDWAHIAKHRYYAGLTLAQTARMLGVTERTVRRHWEKARVLLHDEIRNQLRQQGYEVPVRLSAAVAVRYETP